MQSFRLTRSLMAISVFGVALATSGIARADDTVATSGDLEAAIGAYPGTQSKVNGNVEAEFEDGYVKIEYDLTGLEPNANGGLHIHSGTSCKDAEKVGGHYYAPKADGDYWKNANWVSDSKGEAHGSFQLISGLNRKDNLGHAVVVHASNGSRIGCGILEKE
ncbi:superoxide dismutase family protein [Celerinatantimonas diazotrophica]|uniref:Cu/Zn superoxide dismutase n=1 Tax=Celerinatantimonas diazotrophica TaxID=412034 RepID=A0A4R1K1H1_9GAMM|nr:superoxide dismutase family protein [Celerinatantimonas diazotrophica]TCK57838.1 Cu/Zn superoxide dismutase [Celerinatantimonas diazotrophica]CAG9298098.1 hypothetical protein CEDIAZO_03293 [Celerinatantimonas diazotrophica]